MWRRGVRMASPVPPADARSQGPVDDPLESARRFRRFVLLDLAAAGAGVVVLVVVLLVVRTALVWPLLVATVLCVGLLAWSLRLYRAGRVDAAVLAVCATFWLQLVVAPLSCRRCSAASPCSRSSRCSSRSPTSSGAPSSSSRSRPRRRRRRRAARGSGDRPGGLRAADVAHPGRLRLRVGRVPRARPDRPVCVLRSPRRGRRRAAARQRGAAPVRTARWSTRSSSGPPSWSAPARRRPAPATRRSGSATSSQRCSTTSPRGSSSSTPRDASSASTGGSRRCSPGPPGSLLDQPAAQVLPELDGIGSTLAATREIPLADGRLGRAVASDIVDPAEESPAGPSSWCATSPWSARSTG